MKTLKYSFEARYLARLELLHKGIVALFRFNPPTTP